MDAVPVQTDLLLEAGRLLLTYNESTGAIHRALNTASLHHDFLILEENVVPIDLVRIVFAT